MRFVSRSVLLILLILAVTATVLGCTPAPDEENLNRLRTRWRRRPQRQHPPLRQMAKASTIQRPECPRNNAGAKHGLWTTSILLCTSSSSRSTPSIWTTSTEPSGTGDYGKRT